MADQKNQSSTLDQAFSEVNDELLKMFIKKHRDYGKDNILAVEELGISMRIMEKVQRLKNLLMCNKEPSNESIEETWIDIAVYAVIGVLFRRGRFQELELDPELMKTDV